MFDTQLFPQPKRVPHTDRSVPQIQIPITTLFTQSLKSYFALIFFCSNHIDFVCVRYRFALHNPSKEGILLSKSRGVAWGEQPNSL